MAVFLRTFKSVHFLKSSNKFIGSVNSRDLHTFIHFHQNIRALKAKNKFLGCARCNSTLSSVLEEKANKTNQERIDNVDEFLDKKNFDDSDVPVFVQLKSRSKEQNKQSPVISELVLPNPQSTESEILTSQVTDFPYQVKTPLIIEDGNLNSIANEQDKNNSVLKDLPAAERRLNKTVSGWIKFLEENDVERIKDKDGIQPLLQDLKQEAWRFDYGSPDPAIPPSKLPCKGCGSRLHCQAESVPGYITSEQFRSLSKSELNRVLCQRCTFLQEHNVALSVNVPNEHYVKLLSKIKHKTALVLLLVDVTDFPSSIWPGIVDVIGRKCPVIVVGTKVDLLPPGSDGYLSAVKEALVQNLQDSGVDLGGNLLDVHLISAKTYYGVENLISRIYRLWLNKGDIYLVGCTNVGKSTLFNALLQSDLCNIRAVDLIQRATTSVWPGTTLNLLKFPIHRMSGVRLVHRNQRLAEMNKVLKEERLLRESMYRVTRHPPYATLMGRIDVTTSGSKYISDGINIPTFCNPDDRKFAGSHFCYDTPGAIYTDQILDLLTVEELGKVLPKETIVPRTHSIRGQQTLFLGGVARIDVIQVQNLLNIFLTVFSSDQLPIYIVSTEEADSFYSKNLGSLLQVPCGSKDRLSCFPKLKPHSFQCIGTRFDENCVDITLSSAGWVSVTARHDQLCQLLVYTPEGRGCYLRQPALLPKLLAFRQWKRKPAELSV